jgi:hypothetical protein
LVLQTQQHCEEGPVYLHRARDQETEGDDMNYNLPPLPEPYGQIGFHDVYTADQMRAYAQAALDALADEAEASIKAMIDEAEASIKAMIEEGLGQLTKEKT